MDQHIAPGAFEKFVGLKVPVTIGEMVVGSAEISRDGEVINIELASGYVPRELRDMFLMGLAEGLSIDTIKRPAVPAPAPPTQEQKSQRWNQRNLPFGM